MKKFLLVMAFVVLGTGVLSAQRVAVGRYVMPAMDVVWLSDRPVLNNGKILFLEFFHSTNELCRARVDEVNELAYTYNNILNVVVVAREPAEQVASLLLHDYQNAYVAIDEKGVVFKQLDVPHVPYSIFISAQGKILWAGNPARLTMATIEKILQQ